MTNDTSEQIAVLERKFDYYLWLFRGVVIVGLGWLGVITFLLIHMVLLIRDLRPYS